MLARGNITFVEYQMCKTAKCFYGCAGVNHHRFESEFCSVHIESSLRDSLPDWNAVVSPETFYSVHVAKEFIKGKHNVCFMNIYDTYLKKNFF